MTALPAIRQATPDDAAEIVRLAEVMYDAVDMPAHDEWRKASEADVRLRLRGDDLWGWVIDADREQGGGASGALAASAFVDRYPRLAPPTEYRPWRGYVQWVCTDPAYRRRGYARALMLRVIELADAEGVSLELHASPWGRPLYEELGFAPFPAVEYPAEVRGVPMVRRAPRLDVTSHA